MANMGTAHFTATLDARRVLAVVCALEMLVSVAESYGHRFSVSQQAMLAEAAEACERESLVITAGRD